MLQAFVSAGFYTCFYGNQKRAVLVGLGAGLLSLLFYIIGRPEILPLTQSAWLLLCGRLWQTEDQTELLLGSGLYLMAAATALLISAADPLETLLLTALLLQLLVGFSQRQKWRPLWMVILVLSFLMARGLGGVICAKAWQQIAMEAALYLILGGVLIFQQLDCARGGARIRRQPSSDLAARRPETDWQQTSNEEIQRLLIMEHDFRHHLDMVGALYEAGETEQARAYMEDVKQARLSGRGQRMCSAAQLSYLLMAKKEQCRRAQIRFSYQIVGCPEGIAQLDVATLLLNLVDNAIRACQSAGGTDRAITLMLLSRGLLWQVEMRNTGVYDPAAAPQKGHGLGLVSVRQIAEKYQGSYEIHQDGDEVVQKIILMDQATEKG